MILEKQPLSNRARCLYDERKSIAITFDCSWNFRRKKIRFEGADEDEEEGDEEDDDTGRLTRHR